MRGTNNKRNKGKASVLALPHARVRHVNGIRLDEGSMRMGAEHFLVAYPGNIGFDT